jgi:hypothetical protein
MSEKPGTFDCLHKEGPVQMEPIEAAYVRETMWGRTWEDKILSHPISF